MNIMLFQITIVRDSLNLLINSAYFVYDYHDIQDYHDVYDYHDACYHDVYDCHAYHHVYCHACYHTFHGSYDDHLYCHDVYSYSCHNLFIIWEFIFLMQVSSSLNQTRSFSCLQTLFYTLKHDINVRPTKCQDPYVCLVHNLV